MQKKVWMTTLAAVVIVAVVVTIVVLVITLGRSSTYDKCNQFNAPSGLLVIRNSNGISVSWFSPWPNDECGIFYVLQYDIDDGKEEEVYIHGTSHSLPHPMVCSFLNLRLWAVNEAGDRSNNSATQTYLEMPENGAVTNIEFLPTAAGLEVTWTRPTTLENCTVLYEIKYNPYITGLGTQEVETSKEFFVIPDDMYCFAVMVTIFTHIFDRNVPGSASSGMFTDSSVLTDVVVTQSPENINEMIVRWSKHSRHDVCSLTYEVQFSLDGLTSENTIFTQDLEATFPAHFCSSFFLVMRAHSAITSFTSSWTTVVQTLEMPGNGAVTDIEFFPTAAGLEVTWTQPTTLENCTVLYEIEYNPHITGLSTQQVKTSNDFFVIPDDMYCFEVWVTIFTFVFDRYISGSDSTAIYVDLRVLNDVVVTQSPENINEMIVRWSKHPRHDVCSLTYEVQFSLDDVTNEVTILTQDVEATFPAHFCSSFLLVMRARSAITSFTSRWTTVEQILYPIELGPVQDPSAIVESNLATISWYPPESANDCIDLEYEVSAINEETQEEASCTGPITCSTEVTDDRTSCIAPITCSLSLNSFCSKTTFTIGTISGITQDKSISHECGTN